MIYLCFFSSFPFSRAGQGRQGHSQTKQGWHFCSWTVAWPLKSCTANRTAPPPPLSSPLFVAPCEASRRKRVSKEVLKIFSANREPLWLPSLTVIGDKNRACKESQSTSITPSSLLRSLCPLLLLFEFRRLHPSSSPIADHLTLTIFFLP